MAKEFSFPVAPVAATLASAVMMCLPHPYGAARVLQVIPSSLVGDSLAPAVALEAFVVGVLTFAAYAVFAWRGKRRAGNISAAVIFLVYALVFFVWVAGPLIG